MDWLIFQWHHYALVVLRTSCLLFFWPLWDNRTISLPIRVYSILVISLALTPVASPHLPPFPQTWWGLVGLALQEFLLGFSLGLAIRFLMAGVRMAGDLVAVQMGFGVATLFDPQSNSQTTVIADLLMLISVLIFLSIDGHHLILWLLAQSFAATPMGGLGSLPWQLFDGLTVQGSQMFRLAVKLLAPVIAVLFLTQLSMGLVARAVPQIQIMIVSFPLTIALGLIFISFTLMLTGPFLAEQFTGLGMTVRQVLSAWQG